MEIHVNQHGYGTESVKRAVVRGTADDDPSSYAVVDAASDAVVEQGELRATGGVANWGGGNWRFWLADFSALDEPGSYRIHVAPGGDAGVRSPSFRVVAGAAGTELVSDLLHYFTSQRCRGRYERADASVPFVDDREGTVDVRGGWYDASGDVSKYVSHLHFANYWNPQQIPLVTWSLVDAYERLGTGDGGLGTALWERFLEEACVGADFLVRACDDEGYFYTTVYDGWSGDPAEREICAFEGREGTKTANYAAGWRQGGGMAIAALARTAAANAPESPRLSTPAAIGDLGAFDGETYLATARRAFDYLCEEGTTYLPDGTENLLDDYSALLAATELAATTAVGDRGAAAAGEHDADVAPGRYLDHARERVRSIRDRQSADESYEGWLAADDGTRPFFHPTDEGLPAVALCRYLAVESAGDDGGNEEPAVDDARRVLERFWDFACSITDEVANPYGYARQYVYDAGADETRGAFFTPHENETGYWWLGENARLASLAAAARRTLAHDVAVEEPPRLRRFATDQVDWILGRNPFGVAMLRGVGEPEPAYEPEYPNAPGGIVNGVTAASDDEDDVAFCPPGPGDEHDERWRWAEQWLPHAAWFLQAVAWAPRE